MPGFCRHYGDAHGFRVSHLAYDDDIGRLTQCRAQRCREIRRIRAYFHLFDHAPQVLVLVLNGIFDGYDVPRFPQIDFMDQRGKRRGFSRTRGTTNQHQSAGQMRQIGDCGRQVQFL